MSIITKKVSYNPDVSEYYHSGEMTFIAPSNPKISPMAEPCFLPARFANVADVIRDFEVRPDDIWVISYPKTGTTWTQEMMWMLHNDLDYDGSNNVKLNLRYNYLEWQIWYKSISFADFGDSIAETAASASPRFIKTHLPAALLPLQLWTVKPKIIYVTRNPKDTAISLYHHLRNYHGLRGLWEDFVEAFLANEVLFAPFHSHVLSFWNMRNETNVMFVTYEAMKEDLLPILRRASNFLGKNFSDVELTKLQEHLSFDAMRNNDGVNNMYILRLAQNVLPKENVDKEFRFMRKGVAGGFKTDMTLALIERFDKWNDKKLEGSEFKFAM